VAVTVVAFASVDFNVTEQDPSVVVAFVELRVPPSVENVTGVPSRTVIPLMSYSVAVIVDTADPSAGASNGIASSDMERGGPMHHISMASAASDVDADTVTVCGVDGAVNVTEHEPSVVVAVVELRVPPSVENVTSVSSGTGVPSAAWSVAVSVDCDVPSAASLVLEALSSSVVVSVSVNAETVEPLSVVTGVSEEVKVTALEPSMVYEVG